MNVKKNTQLLLLFFVTTMASAQELYLETGKISSSFDYRDSSGARLDNLQATTNSFMAMGYRTKVFNEKIKATLGAAYTGYGAIGSDDAIEGIMEWQANYLEFSFGLDYKLFHINKVEFYAKGGVANGFLIEGNQNLNNKIINLKKTDDFNKVMVSFKAGAGILYPVSNDMSFYMQYFYGKSLDQTNRGDDESLKIISHSVGFGVLIKLFGTNTTF
jgi:hypothetical protein